MTCKERLAADKPFLTEVELGYIIKEACPDDYGYLQEPSYCKPYSDKCERCWNREILEEKEPIVEELLKTIEEKEREIRILKSRLNYYYGLKIMNDFINGFMNRKD